MAFLEGQNDLKIWPKFIGKLKSIRGPNSEHIFKNHNYFPDPYRQIGFTLGLDLVGLIRSKNMEGEATFKPGEPNDVMYLRQAENFLKKGNCAQALNYLIKSLTMNPESKVSIQNQHESMLMLKMIRKNNLKIEST